MSLEVKIHHHIPSQGYLQIFHQGFFLQLLKKKHLERPFKIFKIDSFRICSLRYSFLRLFRIHTGIFPRFQPFFPGFLLENLPGFQNSDQFLLAYFAGILHFLPEFLSEVFPVLLPIASGNYPQSSFCFI